MSYMSGHVLLNLLNEFGNRNKMRGLPSNVLDFGNELKKYRGTQWLSGRTKKIIQEHNVYFYLS